MSIAITMIVVAHVDIHAAIACLDRAPSTYVLFRNKLPAFVGDKQGHRRHICSKNVHYDNSMLRAFAGALASSIFT
ncbi:hypothetical protein BZA70DRAFT_290056 [Myxozyma melibiosi]|uniref:Secreted protein n=1 Tax=Myxozyma melibiosi TaxID=54550 RepID=A0ABR1F4K5_9ASCO